MLGASRLRVAPRRCTVARSGEGLTACARLVLHGPRRDAGRPRKINARPAGSVEHRATRNSALINSLRSPAYDVVAVMGEALRLLAALHRYRVACPCGRAVCPPPVNPRTQNQRSKDGKLTVRSIQPRLTKISFPQVGTSQVQLLAPLTSCCFPKRVAKQDLRQCRSQIAAAHVSDYKVYSSHPHLRSLPRHVHYDWVFQILLRLRIRNFDKLSHVRFNGVCYSSAKKLRSWINM